MPSRSLADLDLNLLVTLDVLLVDRNLTRAAAALGVSQPAVSASLKKLRRHFADELLVRTGNRYELTPLALRLRDRVPGAVAAVRQIFDTTADFDPATQEREFTLLSSDYATTVVGGHLARLVAAAAPGVRLRFTSPPLDAVEHPSDGLRAIDGILIPQGVLTGLPHLELYEDEWVCVVSADNDTVGQALTLSQLAEMPWVVFQNLPTAFSPAQQQLRLSGLQVRVEAVVDTFLTMPQLIAGTGRVALLQRRLLERLRPAGVRWLAAPFDVVPLMEGFWWHPTHSADPGHTWLRRLLAQAAAEVRADHAD